MASAFCPRNFGRCPHPTPHCIHSPASGGGRRPTPGPPDAAGGAGSGRWDPGLRLPSSPAPAAPPPPAPAPARASFATLNAQGLAPPAPQPRAAPRSARSRSRIGARCAAGGRQGLLEAAGGRDAGAEADPADTRVCGARSQLPSFVGGPPVPMLLFPIPKSGLHRLAGGRQQLPHTGSPRETSAHSQDGPRAPPPGLNPQGPMVPGRHARPTPWPAAVPAHLAGCLLGAKPPRVLRPPSAGPPLLCRGSHPAGEEAPLLISSAPELARRVVPPRRAVRGFHCGEEGAGLPDPATQSTRSSHNSNSRIQMEQ